MEHSYLRSKQNLVNNSCDCRPRLSGFGGRVGELGQTGLQHRIPGLDDQCCQSTLVQVRESDLKEPSLPSCLHQWSVLRGSPPPLICVELRNSFTLI